MLFLSPYEWSALINTLKVASWATVVFTPAALAVAWVLARKKFKLKGLVEVVVMVPLVLPPVVSGYFILLLLAPASPAGNILAHLGWQVVFAMPGMILASGLMGFPLMVRAMKAAFLSVDHRIEEAAKTLGRSPLNCFFSTTLPLAWPGLLAGILLGFARALGEFGATRMVSSNLPGTRTLALEIFQVVENPASTDNQVSRLVVLTILLSVASLAACEWLARKWQQGGKTDER